MTDTLLCKFLVFRKSNDMTCPQNDAFVPSKVSQGENHTRFSGISPFKQIISKHKLAFKGCAYQGIQYHWGLMTVSGTRQLRALLSHHPGGCSKES